MIKEDALRVRRATARLALLPGVAWVFVLVVVASAVARGVSAPVVNILIMMVPALGFVPAFYYAVRLHRATDTERAAQEWSKTVGLAVLGLVLFAVASVIVFEAGRS